VDQIKCELQASFGDDKFIAESAWTSSLDYQKKQSRTDQDVARVVQMLATARHSTPFESIIFRFWMRIPITIDRQLMTHRLQSASGMSGRYRTMPNDYLEPSDDINIITAKLPQERFVQLSNGTQIYGMDDMIERYFEVCESANNAYSQIIAIAKDSEKKNKITNAEFKRIREFYRGMLPQHNMTERVTTMNLRSFANFIKLRNSEHAQPEIKHLAELMLKEVKNKAKCPIAIEFLEKNKWEL